MPLKFELYERSVQNPECDLDFIEREFARLMGGRRPRRLREDFGGTGVLSAAWVSRASDHEAYAIDLDPAPIAYGEAVHRSNLSPDARARLHYLQKNVLDHELGALAPDVVVAFNFSYFIFKKRQELRAYFEAVYRALPSDALFIVDIFGGTECGEPLEEETDHGDFTYVWDCDAFNPLTNETLYKIHFKFPKGSSPREMRDAFVYDWRLWSVREVREIMEEVGFAQSFAYWEGDDGDGGGDGNFFATEEAENCESWVSYIVAVKR